MLAGLAGIAFVFRVLRVRLVLPAWSDIRGVFTDGWALFLSHGAIGLFTTGNSFILGMLASHGAVGYYAAAEKVISSASGLCGPLAAAFYPHSSHLASVSKRRALESGRRLLLAMGCLGGLLTACVFFGGGLITRILLGSTYARSADVMRILAPFILINAVTNVFGIQIMVPFGRDRAFRNILAVAGVGNIALAMLLVPRLAERGTALAMLTSGIVVTLGQILYLYRAGLLPSRAAAAAA
jgi:PST family polysaccharide transporter